MTQPIKIIFFITGLDSGGLENYLLRFLQYKAVEFSEVVVYCKGGKGGQLENDYLTIPNVQIVKNRISFFNPLHYIKLTAYLKKQQFDTICDFTGNFAGLTLLCGKKAGINNRVVFYRGATDHFPQTYLKIKYNDFVKERAYKNASHILSNSQAAFDYFFGERQDRRFQVIFNGINTQVFNVGTENLKEDFNIPKSAFVIGHTGRYNTAKNHNTIIRVAEILIHKYSDIYFILCGNGVKDGLAPEVNVKGISANVRLFDNRMDIPIFLNTMNVYFFPSITEGQPNALIEAMIMGLPFVASDIPPIKETVTDQQYLYNPNDINGFVTALEKMYLDNVQRDADLKEQTRLKFDYKERFNEFYNKLI